MSRLGRGAIAMLVWTQIVSIGTARAQTSRGTIQGRVTDSSGAVLQGASVTVLPGGSRAVTDAEGEYVISGLAAGDYTISVTFVGFRDFSMAAHVAAGQPTRVDPRLEVAGQSESILVTAERPRGEAGQINRERTADNIVQVLSSEVITSLPNANVADALGRLPSVTLERDEGEGKYVQIRGTEPRLSNLTIDGVNVPSPERGVRQIKLDTLASDLVESIEINKTLQANMDGDGIGGSVNIRTKTASEQPTLLASVLGGYTPIIGGRGVSQTGATMGQRFGPNKAAGFLIGGTYDWNGRGINDIEPSPTVTSLTPHYDGIDLRDYMYYRTRWGLSGSSDYRVNSNTSLSVRGLYSTFRNWGQKWVYTLNDDDVPAASIDWRRPDYAVGNIVGSGRHTLASNWLSWDLSFARSRMLQSGGNGGSKFKWNGPDTNCAYDPSATTDPYVPQFSASCYTPGATNTEDIANYKLTNWSPASVGESAQRNVQAAGTFGHLYHAGDHSGTLEFGGKFRDAHKYDDSYTTTYTVARNVTIPIAQFAGGFTDPKYYDNSYPWPLQNVDYTLVQSYVQTHPQQFVVTGGPGANKSNYDLTERVGAGYVMNSIDLSSGTRLIAGVRIESTHVDTLSFNANTGKQDFAAGGNYVDVLPSASVKVAMTPNTAARFVYSRALSRPDPQDLAQAVGPINDTQNPPRVSLGNPALKAEHADNVDVLLEQYLAPLGLIQAGYFYKYLTDPIIATQTRPTSGPYAGFLVSQPGNAGSATLQGFEVAYLQHLGFLPSGLRGLGLSANYSFTASEARGLPLRTDSPALLRQAPHTWNISPTYDRGPMSLRAGISYNGANIYAYQYQNLNSDGTPVSAGDLTAGGLAGPGGDSYLYPHLQFDAQGTVRVAAGLSVVVYGLNLTNEVFGFYNGSPQYVVQREFYKPTFAVGVRWNPSHR
ncbi:MAG TPA: TonB-dependent receptor [Vicinamibacterales bacterium]|nr:TonB-dependent receptor [Vicinamibacterales bacterium]